jgi:predicted PurR-regulated permease PerM
MAMKKLYKIIRKIAMTLVALFLFFYGIIEARTLLYPIVLSVLFAFLLFPFVSILERKNVPRLVSTFFVVLTASAIVIAIAYVLYTEIGVLIRELPDLQAHAQDNIDKITRPLSSNIGLTHRQFKEWMNHQIDIFFADDGIFFTTIFPSTTGTLIALALMPSYIYLFLYYRDKFHQFILMTFPSHKHEKVAEILCQITNVTKRYMDGVCIVVLILMILNTLGLYFIGVKFALLLGILWGLCNFIPYFGILIGASLPLGMAIFTGDSPSQAVSVFIFFLIIQFIENYILTPNITGGSVQVNPLVTIVSIIAGGLVWGIPGMFVVIPVVGIVKILLQNNPKTQPLAWLLGTSGTEEHSITLKKMKAFFQIERFYKKGK